MTAQHPSDATVQPIVVDASAGRQVQAGPMMFRIIEDGSHTSGTHAVLEFTLNGQFSPPPHIHRQHEEVIYVLEGEMLFELEGQPPRVVCAGEAFWEPGGDVIHYSNANNRDDIRCRYTVTMLGSGTANAHPRRRRGTASAQTQNGRAGVEPPIGIEPMTFRLQGERSTTELRRPAGHYFIVAAQRHFTRRRR